MLFTATPHALTEEKLAALRAWAAASIHVGDSPLTGTFSASRGFAVTFTDATRVRERFPELVPYFDLIGGHSLTPLLARLKLRYERRTAEAFYFNLLSVPAGAGVGRHVDATLDWVSGKKGTTPQMVSVLYLETPPGGRLNLWRGEQQVASIEPQPGMCVRFRGDLGHAVEAVDAGADRARVSLVCEHYAFTDEQVARLEPVTVRSVGLFERVLAKKRAQDV